MIRGPNTACRAHLQTPVRDPAPVELSVMGEDGFLLGQAVNSGSSGLELTRQDLTKKIFTLELSLINQISTSSATTKLIQVVLIGIWKIQQA